HPRPHTSDTASAGDPPPAPLTRRPQPGRTTYSLTRVLLRIERLLHAMSQRIPLRRRLGRAFGKAGTPALAVAVGLAALPLASASVAHAAASTTLYASAS